MKEDFDKLLSEIDVEIAKIDLYGNDIIETSLSIVRHLQSIITGLRNELQTYIIGKTKSTNFQNEKYKKIAFTHFSNVM